MKKAAKCFPWIYGIVLATFLFVVLSSITYFRYENSDDILIVKAFMGFEGGKPATFQLYQHTFLSYFLGWISTLIPGIAWFSLLQLGFLWLSLAVIGKCLLAVSSNKISVVAGLVLSGVFTAVFAAFAFARINFTTTAAMLGAAAVIELTSAALRRQSPVGSILFSFLLLIGSYMLRAQSCLACLPFWLIAFMGLLLLHRPAGRMLRQILAAVLCGFLVICGLIGVRAFELRDPDLAELMHFQQANTAPMDYAEDHLLSTSDEALADIGWSRAELALVQQWYFMDENITAEAFEKLDAALSANSTQTQMLSSGIRTLADFFQTNSRYVPCISVLLFIASFIILATRGEKNAFLFLLAAVGTLCAACLLLIYLAFQGRFLSRAADCALFPAAALLCALAVSSASALNRVPVRYKAAALAAAVLCLGCSALHLNATLDVLSDRPDQVSATREANLEAYALENPDKLILRTPNLLRDTRLFPDLSAGLPENIMIWGDWNCRTPSWYAQLEKLGFDGHHFTAADFLNEKLLFVTEQDAPPVELTDYISQGTGMSITPKLVDVYGDLHFFSFQ